MTTAVDTSILLDILADDPNFASSSEAALMHARSEGRLIICESVIAELRPALASDKELAAFLDDIGLEFLPYNKRMRVSRGFHVCFVLKK